MGLGFSHGDASWSYSGFGRFREKIAKEIGIDLHGMYGFGGSKQWSDVNDDIIPLLNHSDCDGNLTVQECKIVAPRIRELVQSWAEDDYDKGTALRLAEGMEEAIEDGAKLRFR